ncbi:hypothetical protein SLA2020_343680 [Shorea laevis]
MSNDEDTFSRRKIPRMESEFKHEDFRNRIVENKEVEDKTEILDAVQDKREESSSRCVGVRVGKENELIRQQTRRRR